METPIRPWPAKHNWRYIARQMPPKRAAVERICDFDEIYDLFDEDTVREQASRCINCPDPPCVEKGCPLANRIPEWLALAADGRFLEAAALSRSTSNMPEICSRVCPQDRLCEGACILNARSDPVSIGAVEKFINEYAFAHEELDGAVAPPNGTKVAVVGSGPGGMACADELAKRGYAVTIFESQSRPGGLLVNGIPSFKLEKEIVERRFDLLRRRGVTVRCGVTVGRDIPLSTLREKFDAVYLAIGAQKPKELDIPGAKLCGIFHALPFLIQKNLGQITDGSLIKVRGKRIRGMDWELGEKADPLAPAYPGIKPEWYFLWEYQLLKEFPPHLFGLEGPQVCLLVIGVMFGIWAIIPWLDRRAYRDNPSPAFSDLGWAAILFLTYLTLKGWDIGSTGAQNELAAAHNSARVCAWWALAAGGGGVDCGCEQLGAQIFFARTRR